MFSRLGVSARLGFDAAEADGRHAGWSIGTGRTADQHSRRQGARLRERSRDLARNDMLAKTVLRTMSVAIYGVRPHCDTDDAALNDDVDKLWDEWAKQCSSATYHGWDGLVQLMVREWLTAGGSLMRGRARRPSDGLVVPLQLELLPVDYLATHLDGYRPDGSRIIQGVELDPIGRVAAYHLWNAPPDDPSRRVVRVSELTAAHLYDPEEVGQQRGTPWLTHAMVAVRDLQLLGDAQRTRAVGESSLMGVVVTPQDLDDSGMTAGSTTETTATETVITEGFTPGTWATLQQGQDIRFNNPTGSSFDSLRLSEIAQIAAAGGVTYEQVSGDLSRTNWTSYRAGQIPHQATVRWVQEELLIPMVGDRVWRWWIDAAIASGILPQTVRERIVKVSGGGSWLQRYPCRWELPAFPEVDEGAAADAISKKLRAGLTTLEYELQRLAMKPGRTYDSMARVLRELAARGIALDSIPSTTTSSGQVQQVPTEPPARHSQP